jgi:hypothetical protein
MLRPNLACRLPEHPNSSPSSGRRLLQAITNHIETFLIQLDRLWTPCKAPEILD